MRQECRSARAPRAIAADPLIRREHRIGLRIVVREMLDRTRQRMSRAVRRALDWAPMNPPFPARAYHRASNVVDDDLALVARMATGDESALAAFFDRWHEVVSAMVARILRDADDADDVVEEAFWQVWRQAPRYEAGRGSVQTWLLTIARTRALDRLRAMRRRREESLEDDAASADARAAGTNTPTPDDPAVGAEHSERMALVRTALQRLPAEQRSALELAYYDGLSQSEIAEQTGQPLGTVKTRVRMALQKLRQALDILREEAR